MVDDMIEAMVPTITDSSSSQRYRGAVPFLQGREAMGGAHAASATPAQTGQMQQRSRAAGGTRERLRR